MRFQMDIKIKELDIENKTLRNDKQKLDIEAKILMEKFNEISKRSDQESKELIFLKNKQADVRILYKKDFNLFETKIERMMREMESLQRENNNLRNNEERLRQDILSAEKQRDIFRDKYQDYKTKANIMTTKLAEIEFEFKSIIFEKEKESELKFLKKSEDSQRKQEKNDSKQKVMIILKLVDRRNARKNFNLQK
jgi:hypothetical protein